MDPRAADANWAPVMTEIRCKCGRVIASGVVADGQQMLVVGGLLIREIHGYCLGCQRAFHFYLHDRVIEQMIKNMKDSEENNYIVSKPVE